MKTILVPTEPHGTMQSVLQTASLLAARFSSHVTGFAVAPAQIEIFAGDPMGVAPLSRNEWRDRQLLERSRKLFLEFMQEKGIAVGPCKANGATCEWTEGEPAVDGFVGNLGRVHDLTIVGRPGTGENAPRMLTLEAALFESGRPILVAPPKLPRTLGESALIAWNASSETARTTALAMPLLKHAKRVVVLSVEGGMVDGPPGEQLARCLAANGIPAEERTVSPRGKSTGETILAEAAALGCDLVVKGAYTQSRLRQMFFGGTTSHLLWNTELPMFMAH